MFKNKNKKQTKNKQNKLTNKLNKTKQKINKNKTKHRFEKKKNMTGQLRIICPFLLHREVLFYIKVYFILSVQHLNKLQTFQFKHLSKWIILSYTQCENEIREAYNDSCK